MEHKVIESEFCRILTSVAGWSVGKAIVSHTKVLDNGLREGSQEAEGEEKG